MRLLRLLRQKLRGIRPEQPRPVQWSAWLVEHLMHGRRDLHLPSALGAVLVHRVPLEGGQDVYWVRLVPWTVGGLRPVQAAQVLGMLGAGRPGPTDESVQGGC